jgi:hypothetical protein
VKLTSVALAAASLFAAHAFGQGPIGPTKSSKASWENVRTLTAFSEIRVITASGETLRGALLRVSGDSLTIGVPSGNTGERLLDRASVKSVALRRAEHRLRHALIGAGVGTLAGAAVALVAASRGSGNCNGYDIVACVVPPPLGAVVGFTIGAAVPAGGWHEIYRNH